MVSMADAPGHDIRMLQKMPLQGVGSAINGQNGRAAKKWNLLLHSSSHENLGYPFILALTMKQTRPTFGQYTVT